MVARPGTRKIDQVVTRPGQNGLKPTPAIRFSTQPSLNVFELGPALPDFLKFFEPNPARPD